MKWLIIALLLATSVFAAERLTDYDILVVSDGEFFVVRYVWAEGPIEVPTGYTIPQEGVLINVVIKTETFKIKSLADLKPTPEGMKAAGFEGE